MAAGLLAGGCSGGGGGTVNPVATPSPSATPAITGVTARQTAKGLDVAVQWAAPTFTPTTNVVEYHIYRNNVLVGVASKATFIYNDAPSIDQSSFTYYTISASDTTKLTLVTVPTPSALFLGVPVTYRVTALYATPETAASATPEYAETEIGQSDAITPQ